MKILIEKKDGQITVVGAPEGVTVEIRDLDQKKLQTVAKLYEGNMRYVVSNLSQIGGQFKPLDQIADLKRFGMDHVIILFQEFGGVLKGGERVNKLGAGINNETSICELVSPSGAFYTVVVEVEEQPLSNYTPEEIQAAKDSYNRPIQERGFGRVLEMEKGLIDNNLL